MDVPASPAALSELQDRLGAFQVRFRRPEGGQAVERYRTGRLIAWPSKSGDTMAQAVPGTSEQRWQEFLTKRPWDAEDLNRQRVAKMITEATLGDGVLVLGDPGFPKQGQTSVGVARQYAGTLGKVGHGQSAVTCCDTDPQVMGPVAVRLYLPPTWAEDLERRGKARVPEEVTCQTKPAMALALLDQACAWGVPHRCVVADAGDDDHPPLPGRGGGGGRFGGGKGAKAGCGSRVWPCVAGESPVRGKGMSAGCWESAPCLASLRSGSTPGAICRPRPRWKSLLAMPIGGMPSNSSMKRPNMKRPKVR